MAEAEGLGRGVLYQRAVESRFRLRKYPPSPELGPFVGYYWLVPWGLRGGHAYEQAVLPHPNVHLTFEPDQAAIYGVVTRLYLRKLEGDGVTLGVRFWPGGFRPFWPGPVNRLTGQIVPASPLLGPAAEQARAVVVTEPDDAAVVACVQDL